MSYWRDKVALITGGSGGLGRALAGTLAAAGARVIVTARNADPLEATAVAIRQRGGQATAMPADITCQDQVERLFQQAIGQFGRLDMLVNSAGRSQRGEAIDTTPEEFCDLMALNFIAAVRCTRAAVPHLLASRGHVVNIGSLAGKAAVRYVGAYPATKFALSAYSAQLRLELGPRGLHVLLVSPGPIAREDAEHRYADQAAGLPETAKKPGAGVKFNAISPEKLSRAILRACERRQPELMYPGMVRLLVAIGQLSPRLGDWIVRRLT
jgi:short-subunit dehydrogenase